jgi:GABA permease
MWLFPWLTIVGIVAMVGILGAMAFIPDQRIPLATGLVSLAIAVVLFWLSRARDGRTRRN